MLDFFKQIFSKKSDQESYSDLLSKNNAITFLIDKDNNIFTYVSAVNLSNNDAKQFAEMLHGLCGGLYTQNILQILLGLSKEGDDIKQFIDHTINNWATTCHTKIKDDSVDDAPVIKPTIFFDKMLNKHEE